MTMTLRPTRILILGGGFGGVYTALTLETLLKKEIRRGEVELGLVSRENYMVFQPMLPEVISGSIGILDTITPIRRLCPDTNLYTRTVESIDFNHRSVTATAGFGSRQHHLHWDHLVLPLGTVTGFAGQPVLREIRVILVHAGGVILPELPASLGRFAQDILMKRGVEIRFHTLLAGATADAALLQGGDRIATRTLVSTVPSGPNPLIAMLPLKMERGRVAVDPTLAVPDYPGVWAVGDCAAIRDAKTGELCPPTAQHATREAQCVARNIVATLRGEPRRAFSFKALGKMGALGRRSAVAEIFGMKVSGFLAWWLWRTIYLMKLPGLDRKIRVATDWTLDLILPPDIVQLETRRALGVRREYFEPGQVIFREGDRGDQLYV